MARFIKKGEKFKLTCNMCGKDAFIDTLQFMENINKVYAIIQCIDNRCGHKQILDGTLPKDDTLHF